MLEWMHPQHACRKRYHVRENKTHACYVATSGLSYCWGSNKARTKHLPRAVMFTVRVATTIRTCDGVVGMVWYDTVWCSAQNACHSHGVHGVCHADYVRVAKG